MKTLSPLFVFLLLLGNLSAQHSPQWTRNLDTSPDSAWLHPVKTITDDSAYVYCLSFYGKTIGSITTNKIYVNKFDQAGTNIYSFVFDNNGNGSPRGFDFVCDGSGNIYVAGGLMEAPSFNPILLKISAGGSLVWVIDSVTAFATGNFTQVHLRNNKLFATSTSGTAAFDLNGNELWSNTILSSASALDNSSRLIVSSWSGNPNNFFIIDSMGTVLFSDSTIEVRTITTDYYRNIYTLTDFPEYTLAKYDSTGALLWYRNSFPVPPPFGDISCNVEVDNNLNVYAIGLSDTMYRFDPSGNLEWSLPMNGMDNYIISTELTWMNMIAVAGILNGPSGYDVQVKLFNQLGGVAWEGTYNSNNQQEFPVSIAIDSYGIYVLEDSINNTDLIKFESPIWIDTLDPSLVCVDSIWYDPADSNFINIRIFNGDLAGVNYPFVHIIDANGDTISNKFGQFSFFVHMGNQYLTYTDSIYVQGISDWSNYIIRFYDGSMQLHNDIGFCTTLGVEEDEFENFQLFPNPSSGIFILKNPSHRFSWSLFSMAGQLLYDEKDLDSSAVIDMSNFPEGIYLIRIKTIKGVKTVRLVKTN